MPYYMPQSLFNTLAYTIAWGMEVNASDTAKALPALNQILGSYRQFYVEDNFRPDVTEAAQHITGWLAKSFPQRADRLQILTALMEASKSYHPNGTKMRRRWIFNGLRYTSSQTPVPERGIQCMKDTLLYHVNLMNGRIPAASLELKDGKYVISR